MCPSTEAQVAAPDYVFLYTAQTSTLQPELQEAGITVRIHHERRGTAQVDADRTEGQVDLGLRLPIEPVVQHITDDPHDVDQGIVSAEKVGKHADESASDWRTAVVQKRPHKRFVHQHGDCRRGRVRLREDRPIGEPDVQRLDVRFERAACGVPWSQEGKMISIARIRTIVRWYFTARCANSP